MGYLFRRNELKPNVGKEQIDHLLDKLLSYNSNHVHIVYTNRSSNRKENDFLEIRNSDEEGKIQFFKTPYIPMRFSSLTHEYLTCGEEILTELPYKTPEIVKQFEPRRISIEDSSVKQVGKYIPSPYEFLGFEVTLPIFGIDVFASSYQRCAGIKRFRRIENEHKKDVARITHHLNDLIYPTIRVDKVVG